MFRTPNRTITRIELEYDDGEVRRAVGEDAEAIWQSYSGALDFYLARSKGEYTGPHMVVVRDAVADDLDGEVMSLAELAEQRRNEGQLPSPEGDVLSERPQPGLATTG